MGLISSYFYPKEEKKNKLSDCETAILKLKKTRDNIKKLLNLSENKKDNLRKQAKEELKQGNREKAKNCLNRSKLYDIKLESSNGMLMMIYEQINQLESAEIQGSVIESLEKGNKVLKDMQEDFSKLDQIRDDMEINRENYNELNNFFKENNYNEEKFDNEIENSLKELLNDKNLDEKNKEDKEDKNLESKFPNVKDLKKKNLEGDNIKEKNNDQIEKDFVLV